MSFLLFAGALHLNLDDLADQKWLVADGYEPASRLHMSGPLAVVVAGLMIGNHGRRYAMSEKTERKLGYVLGVDQ